MENNHFLNNVSTKHYYTLQIKDLYLKRMLCTIRDDDNFIINQCIKTILKSNLKQKMEKLDKQ